MENNGDLQPIARNMNPTLWVPSENLSFGLLPEKDCSVSFSVVVYNVRMVNT